MEFLINIDVKKPSRQINYKEKILLVGSCFTEHIGNALDSLKFSVLQNPNGILFDAFSVSKSINSYIENRKYELNDFFKLNEAWHSWNHHSRFSNVDGQQALNNINASQQLAHEFLLTANWLIITLGSSFSYQLSEEAVKTNEFDAPASQITLGVANCHRAPAQWFNKKLLTVEEITSSLDNTLRNLFLFNPNINVIFTVSPVRHIRDGVVENNRSKARLIESVHELLARHMQLYYFPAYELVIDVLRDYRFYDVDLVHPNYMATSFVLEKFSQYCIDDESQKLMEEVKSIVTARKHRALQPATSAHKLFLNTFFEKTKALKGRFPFLDLEDDIKYFGNG